MHVIGTILIVGTFILFGIAPYCWWMDWDADDNTDYNDGYWDDDDEWDEF